jgi:hypothetical protein
LRIGIDQEHPSSTLERSDGQTHRRGALADSPLLPCERDDHVDGLTGTTVNRPIFGNGCAPNARDRFCVEPFRIGSFHARSPPQLAVFVDSAGGSARYFT